MHQLLKDDTVLIEAPIFDKLWRAVVDHYGHLTIKEFNDNKMKIVKV